MENTQPMGGSPRHTPRPSATKPQNAVGASRTPPCSPVLPRPAPGACGPGLAPSQARVRLSSPADVLAVVPHLLGFHPANSLVVIGARGSRERVELGFRYDLPDPPDSAWAAEIADHAIAVLTQRRIGTVIGVGYGPGRLVTPVVDVFTAAVRRSGLRLRELLRVEDGRYWSYLCRNVTCCPAEGVAFDPRSHPASAALALAGLAAYPDRESRARAIAPVTGEQARAMERATRRACERAAKLIARAKRQGRPDSLRLVLDEGRAAVRAAIGIYRDGGQMTDEDEIAWLTVTLANLPVRDDAWARMEPRHRDAHLRLWTDLVRRAELAWVPGPAALLAFTAWQCGDGALANIAIERALAADPQYSMALLLRDVIDAGVPPSAARIPMTPEEVADSYARDGGQRDGAARDGSAVGRRRGAAGQVRSGAGRGRGDAGRGRTSSGGAVAGIPGHDGSEQGGTNQAEYPR